MYQLKKILLNFTSLYQNIQLTNYNQMKKLISNQVMYIYQVPLYLFIFVIFLLVSFH